MKHARDYLLAFVVGILIVIVTTAEPAAAGAETPSPTTAIIQGAIVAPPLSYLNFCERHVDQCGQEAVDMLAGSSRRSQVANGNREDGNNPSAMRPPVNSVSGFDWGMVFSKSTSGESVAYGKQTAARRQVGLDDEPDKSLPVVTPEFWQQLRNVNEKVNNGVRSVSDISHYGVEDYWELPFESGGNAGDCEDYVLEKRKMLLSLGVSMQTLSIALVKTPWNESHAVLLVRTAQGDYVLDNLTPMIEPWKSSSYKWIKWQSRSDPDVWVRSVKD